MGLSDKVTLRRSARDEILWHLHAVLDSVLEDPAGREEFARRILREFGVSGASLEECVARVCDALPENLAEVDMVEILGTFEAAIPIEWHNDQVEVDGHRVNELRAALLRVLAERTPDVLPKAVTGQILAQAERVLGPALTSNLLLPLRTTIENLLVHELWRSHDPAAREQLAERLMYSIRTGARLHFRDR